VGLAGVSRGAGPTFSLGDAVPVTLPASDCSLGICTFNFGRFTSDPDMLGVRGGGSYTGIPEVDAVLIGGLGGCDICSSTLRGAGEGLLFRMALPTSIECDRMLPSVRTMRLFLCVSVGPVTPQCCANMDRLSSTGV